MAAAPDVGRVVDVVGGVDHGLDDQRRVGAARPPRRSISAARSPGPGIEVPRSSSSVVLARLQRLERGLALGARRDELRVLGGDLGLRACASSGRRAATSSRAVLIRSWTSWSSATASSTSVAEPADPLDDRLVVLLDPVDVLGLAQTTSSQLADSRTTLRVSGSFDLYIWTSSSSSASSARSSRARISARCAFSVVQRAVASSSSAWRSSSSAWTRVGLAAQLGLGARSPR